MVELVWRAMEGNLAVNAVMDSQASYVKMVHIWTIVKFLYTLKPHKLARTIRSEIEWNLDLVFK